MKCASGIFFFAACAALTAVGVLASPQVAQAATAPSVTIAAPTVNMGTVSFTGTVVVGNPVWTAGNPIVNIVQTPSGPAIPGVPGQVNVTQTGWANASTTLPAGTYNATVSMKFTRAGQPAQTLTATVSFTVP